MNATHTIKSSPKKIAGMVLDWQASEDGSARYADAELSKVTNPLTRTMLQALKLEAQKRSLIQQMIVDSITKEAVHLSPEELEEFSRHLNRYIEEEEKALCSAREAADDGLMVPHYLMSYLMADLHIQNSLLRQLDDDLKIASIPTSATSKQVDHCRAA